jgi:hypothetical protein
MNHDFLGYLCNDLFHVLLFVGRSVFAVEAMHGFQAGDSSAHELLVISTPCSNLIIFSMSKVLGMQGSY